MKCDWIKIGDMTAVLCGPRGARRSGTCSTCGRPAGFQCDTVVTTEGKEGTCDAWCCALHAVKVGPNRHRCQGCIDRAYLLERKR